MYGQALLPFGDIAGSLKTMQSQQQTAVGKAAPGFAMMLQSAGKGCQEEPDAAETVNGAKIPVGFMLPLLETDVAAKDPELLDTDGTKAEIADAALTGLFALQLPRTEFISDEVQTQGVSLNHVAPEPATGLVDGLDRGAAPENEKVVTVPSQNDQNPGSLKQEANLEKTNAALWNPSRGAEAASRQGEDPSRGNLTSSNAKLASPGNADLSQSRQLIAAEMEKHHGVKLTVPVANNGAEMEKPNGVKAPVLAGNDGITTETPQSPINLTPNEIASSEKVPVSQEKVSTQDIINQVVRKIEFFTGPKSKTVSIQLEPEFLGRLQINLEVVDDVLIAKFSTDNPQVKQLLESGIGQLRSQLEASGIRLEKAEVNIDLGHHFGPHQNPNDTGHQNRQHVPYEAGSYYGETMIGDYITLDMEGSPPETRVSHEGTVDYLI